MPGHWVGPRPFSTILVQRALQEDVRASPIPREGNRDLLTAGWLLPSLAVEQAGSSKIRQADGCWELGLMNRTMVTYVSSEPLSIPPMSFSSHQSDFCGGASG